MQKAINLAIINYKEGGLAVAAIITKNDEIISEACTTILRDRDPVCHAEMNAIRSAARKLRSCKLENCYLYTTYEPCPMCASAAIWAKMKGIVYGAAMADRTESHPQRVNISAADIIKKGDPVLELYPEFMREECKKLLTLV